MKTSDYIGKVIADIKINFSLDEMIITFTDDTRIIVQCQNLRVYEEGTML